MDKIRVMVVMDFEVNGEYDSSQFDNLNDQIQSAAEESELYMLDLYDGTRLTLDKVAVESVEEI